jgi:hypothetical protein
MAKNKVNLMEYSSLLNHTEENNIIDSLYQKHFLKIMKKEGFSFLYLQQLLEMNKVSSNEQLKINYVLRKLKKEFNIELCESIIYLEQIFTTFKKIIILLDDQSKSILKEELINKYKIKEEENNLMDLIR